jgi:hypothetical protein
MRLQTTLTSKAGFALVVALMLLGIATHLSAASQPGKIEVKATSGQVTSYIPGGTPAPLKAGAILAPGSTVKTGKESSADLFLGKNIGTIRVEENTTLSIDKLLLTDTGADNVVDVQLNLPEGTILGNVNKLSAASKYEIKVPNGVAGIRGTRLLASANSYFVLLDGALVFVHVPPGGNPTPYTLQAPPAVYFSPLEGVKNAPLDLVQNVEKRFTQGVNGPPFTPPGPPPGVPFQEPFVSPGLGQPVGKGK